MRHCHPRYMHKHELIFTFVLIVCLISVACSTKEIPISDLIRFNQLGFYPEEEKVAVVADGDVVGSFNIREVESGKIVYSGKASQPRTSLFSDEKTVVLSFSDFEEPGEYVIEVPSVGQSRPFSINRQLLQPVSVAALKAFYYQRSATPIDGQYAGVWSRPVAHPDNSVMIHSSAVSKGRPEGFTISSAKGWYDAGDYNKYIVNSGFTVGVLLSLCEDYPDYVKQLSTNIPESGNVTPDLLDEVYWNLSWMLTMQDPADGGVYHKLTTPSFEGFIKPIDCAKQRYVVAKSVTAALGFAASMAQASRVYAGFEADYPGASAVMLEASKRAFSWALKHPEAYYRQKEMNEQHQPAVVTGEYGDSFAGDEFFWAAAELYITTGDDKYLDTADKNTPAAYALPTWSNVGGLGCQTLIRHSELVKDKGRGLVEEMRGQLLAYADSAVAKSVLSPYAATYGRAAKDFFWGCNSDAASNQGISFLYAWKQTKDKKYLDAALHNMDYLLGRNATGYCYITGFGTKSPMNPHHRLSASDEIAEPIPGFLVGGPNPGKQDGCEYASAVPDKCYADVEASYASNEIAINWQGLFAYFAVALDASMQ